MKFKSFWYWFVFTLILCAFVWDAAEAFKASGIRSDVGDKAVAMKYSSGDMRALVNRWRVGRGLKPLEYDRRLDEEAQRTAEHNARVGKLIHHACGKYARGEIIAYNSTGFAQAVDQWEKSPDHCRLMSSGKYTRAGCACVRNGERFYCCVRFR